MQVRDDVRLQAATNNEIANEILGIGKSDALKAKEAGRTKFNQTPFSQSRPHVVPGSKDSDFDPVF